VKLPLALLSGLLAVSLCAAPLRAGDDEVLPALQRALLLLKVLAYDRNLHARAGSAVAVAVVHRRGDAASDSCSAEVLAALEELAKSAVVSGLPISAADLPWSAGAAFESALQQAHPTALFICPGLEPELPAIREAARRRSVFTAASGRQLAEKGLSLGLVSGAAHARLVINIDAARAEGADLDSALLHIAEVVRDSAPNDAGPAHPAE